MGSNNAYMPLVPAAIGKSRRMQRIFSDSDKCVIVPLDDSLISYSREGLLSLKDKIYDIQLAKPNGILCYEGTASLITAYDIPLIINVTASTMRSAYTNKVLISCVENALRLDASAVAVHINISSKYESDMLRNLGIISSECNKYGVPLMVITYPRTEDKNGDDNYEILKINNNEEYTRLVSHCVRVAFELGADIIKTQYTGSEDSFREVVKAGVCKPVVIAGGSHSTEEVLYDVVQSVISAGGAGVSIGRNVFNRPNSSEIINRIKKIVFSSKEDLKHDILH